MLNNGFNCNKSGFVVETFAIPAAKKICSSVVSTSHRTDRKNKDRRTETNVLLSREGEREHIFDRIIGNDLGKSLGVICSLPKEPVSATIAPKK